ncbi:hypothetical protein CPB97_007558 [Podila verticillata]|nr:hypothetical protein CPB97_007558 [Podila verticillata]
MDSVNNVVLNVDNRPSVEQGSSGKRRLNINPAKAVIGGITQSTHAVRGGLSQMEKGVNNVGGKLTKVPGISQGVSMFADYRKFLDRGNVIDLAVAVVIGAAFTGIVDSLVKDIIAPLISLASGKALEENFVILRKDESFVNPDYSTRESVKASMALSWNYGNFVQTVVNFFIISACVFVIVKLYQMGRNTKTAVTEKKCRYCTASIELDAVRCSHCTSWLDMNEYYNLEQLMAQARDGPRSDLQKEEYSRHGQVDSPDRQHF